MRRNREEIIKLRFTILNHLKNISRGRLFNRHKDIDIAFVNVGTNMLILEYENSNQEERTAYGTRNQLAGQDSGNQRIYQETR